MNLIDRVSNVFLPNEALPPGDPRYVECSKERGSVGLFKSMEIKVRRMNEPTCQLLSGHRGCGKSTEFFRLKDNLSKGDALDPRHFVVYCEITDYADLADIEYVDVLLAVVQQLWSDVDGQGIQLTASKYLTLMDELKSILPEARLKEINVSAWGGVGFKGEFLKNDSYRSQVRERLRPRPTSLLDAVNEVIQLAERDLRAKGWKGLVIIVDNLDRILRKTSSGSKHTNHDELFIHNSRHLCGLQCDVIYTIPSALLRSGNGGQLRALYGAQPHMLPMIPISKQGGGEDEAGIAKLIEIVKARMEFAGTTLKEAFDSEKTLNRLCIASGGYTRSLITLVQDAVAYIDDLPITAEAVEQTIRDARDGYRLSIRQQQWQSLRGIAREKAINETEAANEDFLQLLESFAVLEYRDMQGPWYDVNPVLKEAREFNQ